MAPLQIVLNEGHVSIVAVIAAIAAIAVAMSLVFRTQVLKFPEGTDNMRAIAVAVQEGAAAYLGRQFRTLGLFAAGAFLLLFLLPAHSDTGASEWFLRTARSVAFLIGAGFSALIGYLGMWLAVRANVRVATAARDEGRDPAMRVAFRTGAAVGMATIGLGLLGAALVVLFFRSDAPTVLEGFGFGAAMLAMFMRVGGGIFT
ncbi:MAG: sodium/proton-translocating pyrophosphatase, partial [Propionibacteriaceae bacterium]|nr:sodium/proton-translocating pyrophosphatase [Propionibacteriaceae bacterium]